MIKKVTNLLRRYPPPHPSVMNGELAFRLVDTYGLPLEVVILKVQERGLFIDWVTFAKVATASGWNNQRINACRRLANSHYTEKWVAKIFGMRGNNG